MADETPEPRSGWKTALVFSMFFAILVAVIVLVYFSTFRRQVTTVILIRHAEKVIDPNNNDVDLSPAGQQRAQELVRMFADTGINAIYATQYKRTQETVKPLADKLGLPVTIVNSKGTADLLTQIKSKYSGQTIFIAGHNSTVPEIIHALGGPQYPTIPESEYDNLFVVTVYSTGKAQVVKMRYGAASQ
jgi:2,3-bisphosphoglycerate-dependent phosphoglycerate mutase